MIKKGYQVKPIFNHRFKSKSLQEIWGQRWNLAFSEITSQAVFKPFATKYDRSLALFVAVMVSGLLHEVALSLSVKLNFDLPMLYFTIHGILMLCDNHFFKKKKKRGVFW